MSLVSYRLIGNEKQGQAFESISSLDSARKKTLGPQMTRTRLFLF